MDQNPPKENRWRRLRSDPGCSLANHSEVQSLFRSAHAGRSCAPNHEQSENERVLKGNRGFGQDHQTVELPHRASHVCYDRNHAQWSAHRNGK